MLVAIDVQYPLAGEVSASQRINPINAEIRLLIVVARSKDCAIALLQEEFPRAIRRIIIDKNKLLNSTLPVVTQEVRDDFPLIPHNAQNRYVRGAYAGGEPADLIEIHRNPNSSIFYLKNGEAECVAIAS
jgi:hypothetical protein